MPAPVKTILIGIFVIIAAGIVVSMLLYIHPTVGDNAKTLRMRFTDVDKIDIGTRVTYSGHPVGEVISIRELPEARTERESYKGNVYVYEVEAKVDSGVNVFNTDEISARTSGLLGEKNIEITPLPAQSGQPLYQVENQVIYAVPSGTVESTLKKFSELTKKIEETLDSVQSVIDLIKKEEIVQGIGKITRNLVDITHALNRPEKWSQTLDNITTLSERANKSWTTVDSTLDQLHAAAINAKDFTHSANQIIEQTKRGQGTLGHLFVGNDLYLQVKSILHKGENLMNDINRFGLLFQTNKRWQRLEAERRRLVQNLSDPNQFSEYFDKEMDQISNSLFDVSMIINESQGNDPSSLRYNPDFINRFTQLMRNVEGMEETIKLYNEQLNSQECALSH